MAEVPARKAVPSVLSSRRVPPPERGPNRPAPRKNPPNRPRQLLELACLAARAEWGGVGLLSIHGELVEHLTSGAPESRDKGGAGLAGLVQFVLRQPGPVNLMRWAEAGLEGVPALAAEGPFLAVPLDCPGRGRGVLYLARKSGAAAFGAEDVEAALGVGSLLEQGSLLEEARQIARMRLLNLMAQTAAGNIDLAAILRVALRELDRQLPLQACAIWLVEEEEGRESRMEDGGSRIEDREPPHPCDPRSPILHPPFSVLVLAETSGVDDVAVANGWRNGLRLPINRTPFGPCLSSGQAHVADLAGSGGRHEGAEDLHPAFSALHQRASSALAVPLRAGERTVGVLQSVCLRPAGFTGDQIQFLYLVADLLGPAISNCQLFGRLSSAYEALRQAQGRLIQAEKMRALGELAGGMAHEFNNALCGVLGFLEIALTNKDLLPQVRDHLDAARGCALDAAQTVSRVQDFSRWRREERAHEPLDLNDLVRQCVERVRHKWEGLDHARGTPIQVEIRTEATAPVAGNATELREVVTNLAFNAVDAMPRGGTLTLHTWSTPAEVFLAVRDTGTGIPESVRHRLFEPFFTTKGERGNGLGLSVSFGIVKRHGGEIEVESQPGKGTTFLVRLPAASGRPLAAGEKAPPTAPAAPGRGLRVLVIEDEENVRRFLSTALKGLGHVPRTAANAREGLALFREGPIDVVLTDLGLPGTSGEEVARSIRQTSPHVPVILLTGWAGQLQAEEATLEGVSRILSKPVTLATLSATLQAVCPR